MCLVVILLCTERFIYPRCLGILVNIMFFKVFLLTTKMDSDLIRNRTSIAGFHKGIAEMSMALFFAKSMFYDDGSFRKTDKNKGYLNEN